jgi:Scavenger receptor cysteine-rich domain
VIEGFEWNINASWFNHGVDFSLSVHSDMLQCCRIGRVLPPPSRLPNNLPKLILLDDVSCTGSEDYITDCRHSEWGEHDCRHLEDVYVSCSQSRPTKAPKGWPSSSPYTVLHANPQLSKRYWRLLVHLSRENLRYARRYSPQLNRSNCSIALSKRNEEHWFVDVGNRWYFV